MGDQRCASTGLCTDNVLELQATHAVKKSAHPCPPLSGSTTPRPNAIVTTKDLCGEQRPDGVTQCYGYAGAREEGATAHHIVAQMAFLCAASSAAFSPSFMATSSGSTAASNPESPLTLASALGDAPSLCS